MTAIIKGIIDKMRIIMRIIEDLIQEIKIMALIPSIMMQIILDHTLVMVR